MSLDYILLVSRWIHIFAAVVAIGGAVFQRLVLISIARDVCPDDVRNELFEKLRCKWTPIVHTCIGLLLITGLFNFYWLAIRTPIDPMPYHAVFGLKFIAALVVFAIAILLTSSSKAVSRIREHAGMWLGVLIFFAAAIVAFSGVLGQVRAASGD